QVETVLGTGSPGITSFESNRMAAFEAVQLHSPRGVASESNGNVFVADTENHALYFVNLATRTVQLLAGTPGEPGKGDGPGQTARFSRPAGLALSRDGRVLAVADQDNNCVRLLELIKGSNAQMLCQVSTVSTTRPQPRATSNPEPDEFEFNHPQSVSFDSSGNIIVVDESSVYVIARPLDPTRFVIQLAQLESYSKAVSATVRGTETFVLDAEAVNPSEAITVVTVGAPEITGLSQESVRIEGGAEIILTGRNFAPETLVFIGDTQVENFQVESATQIRLIVPRQSSHGDRTLTVQTRGGVAQAKLTVLPKPFAELVDGEITTLAGGVPYVGDGGLATAPGVALNPFQTIVDGAGNFYIADGFSNRIRRIAQDSGIITTVAGNGNYGFTGDGGPATTAGLAGPTGIAFDRQGNLHILDSGNLRIRRVDATTGVITTVAGDGRFNVGDDNGDGHVATQASFRKPVAIAFDSSDNLYIADALDYRVRRVDAQTRVITTVAGSGELPSSGEPNGDGGPAIQAKFVEIKGIAVDGQGNLLITDGFAHRVRQVDFKTGIITTIAGVGTRNGIPVFDGDGGPATNANLNAPGAVAIDSFGNILIADTRNRRIRRIDAQTGIISTIAGNGTFEFGGDGGPALMAGLSAPVNIAVDGLSNIYLTDPFQARIRRIDASTGIITTVAGNGTQVNQGDFGPATSSVLYTTAVVKDTSGNIFLADNLLLSNQRLRRVDAVTGIIRPFSALQLDFPGCLTSDASGNLLSSDSTYGRIVKIDAQTQAITPVAGTGVRGFSGDGGAAVQAQLLVPTSLAFDQAGNLFIADTGNGRVRRVDAQTGKISTIAGAKSGQLGVDGIPATRAKLFVSSIAVDLSGNLYLVDGNTRIRRVDGQTGIITTVAGNGCNPDFSDCPSDSDGVPATQVSLSINGVAVDAQGNLFVATRGFSPETGLLNRIRRVDASTGLITTVAGMPQTGSNGDGGPAAQASFVNPGSLSIDEDGNLLLSDDNAVRIIKGIAKVTPSESELKITNALFADRTLTIDGTGFTQNDLDVVINDRSVRKFITRSTSTQILLTKSEKKLNLKPGENQITVRAGGRTSNVYLLSR
ncbi:MAG TPA: IPT/TIG domain-containing protein, partial [Acidobacteriota bacterium]|nr:IPT/TIG domain-containing protein [Acidobacteriota bacterium]